MYPGGVYKIHVSRWSIQDTCIQVDGILLEIYATCILVEFIKYSRVSRVKKDEFIMYPRKPDLNYR